MKILLVFDKRFSLGALDAILANDVNFVHIFPLTSDYAFTESVLELLCSKGVSVAVAKSAELVDKQVKDLRTNLPEWSDELGDAKILGRRVRDWFNLGNGQLSAWWLGFMGTIENRHTALFLVLAQYLAFKEYAQSLCVNKIILAIKTPSLKKSIITYVKQQQYAWKTLTTVSDEGAQDTLFKRIKKAVKEGAILGSCSHGLYRLSSYFRYYVLTIRDSKVLISHAKFNGKTVALSCFPNLDEESLHAGRFVNKYYPQIQQVLESNPSQFSWLFMPSHLKNYSYKKVLELERKVHSLGFDSALLFRFFNVLGFVKITFFWVRTGLKAFFIYLSLRVRKSRNQYLAQDILPIAKSIWFASFVGHEIVDNLTYYVLFCEFFKQNPACKLFIYFHEFQAWEKALNAAALRYAPSVVRLGYQHTTIPLNHYNAYYSATNLAAEGALKSLLPSYIASNGEKSKRYFHRLGYKNVIELEAFRYLYLNESVGDLSSVSLNNSCLLVIASFSYDESRAMLAMVRAAFSNRDGIQIFCKPHPSAPLDDEVARLNDEDSIHIQLTNEPVTTLLHNTQHVFVRSSTAAIEALLHGCHVVVPRFVDSTSFDSLDDIPSSISYVDSAEALRGALKNPLPSSTEYKDFKNDVWYLDSALPKWRAFLDEHGG